MFNSVIVLWFRIRRTYSLFVLALVTDERNNKTTMTESIDLGSNPVVFNFTINIFLLIIFEKYLLVVFYWAVFYTNTNRAYTGSLTE